MSKTGYVVGYETVSGNKQILDAIVYKNNGKYTFLEANNISQEEDVHAEFVNVYNYLKDTEVESSEKAADSIQDGLMVCEQRLENGKVFTALISPAFRNNCLMRIHYMTDEEKNRSLVVRVEIEEHGQGTDAGGYNLQILEAYKMKDYTQFDCGPEETRKIFAGKNNLAMIVEAELLQTVQHVSK